MLRFKHFENVPSRIAVAGMGLLLFPLLTSAGTLGDGPAFPLGTHVDQFQISNGTLSFPVLFNDGDQLSGANFNNYDGVGSNLNQDATVSLRFSRVPRADLPGFTSDQFRATGPNATGCRVCHDGPGIPGGPVVEDGSGDTAMNAHRDPKRTKLLTKFIQRNTPHLFGAGALQNLAQEMTTDLLAIKASTVSAAQACFFTCTKTNTLVTKGITFGTISATKSFGSVTVDASGVKGVTQDLVVRPYEWKGSVAFLRDFVRGAADNEIGMQPDEMVGVGVDQDKDGVVDEFTVGDITAITLYMAAQPRPVTMTELNTKDPVTYPLTSAQLTAISAGQTLFTQANCSGCHVPSLTMNDPVFREPSANANYRDSTFPSGANPVNLGLDPTKPATFNFLTDPEQVVFKAAANGGAIVPLYSDLRWHDMGTGLAEAIDEAGNGASVFITKPLWGVGSTAPYMHDGRAPTLTAAILTHGGEAQAARDAFAAMSAANQANLIEFLKNLVLFKVPG